MRFSFFLSEALGSMRRNWVMAMAAVITVFVSMAILGAVLVSRYNLNQGATSLKNRVLSEVFIKDQVNSDNAQVKALQAKILTMPEVKAETVRYISKDEALQRFEDKFGSTITANLNLNPLPASFEIQVKDPNDVDKVASRFFDDPRVDNTAGTHDGVKYAKETVRKMLGTISLVENGMWVITVVFAVAAVLLISTTVRLRIFARRRAVEIMRLVAPPTGSSAGPRAGRLRHGRARRASGGRPGLGRQLDAEELDHCVGHQLPEPARVRGVVAERHRVAGRAHPHAWHTGRGAWVPGEPGRAASPPQGLTLPGAFPTGNRPAAEEFQRLP
jgi:cell division transport system permease protein